MDRAECEAMVRCDRLAPQQGPHQDSSGVVRSKRGASPPSVEMMACSGRPVTRVVALNVSQPAAALAPPPVAASPLTVDLPCIPQPRVDGLDEVHAVVSTANAAGDLVTINRRAGSSSAMGRTMRRVGRAPASSTTRRAARHTNLAPIHGL
jgi:hypothetical protein